MIIFTNTRLKSVLVLYRIVSLVLFYNMFFPWTYVMCISVKTTMALYSFSVLKVSLNTLTNHPMLIVELKFWKHAELCDSSFESFVLCLVSSTVCRYI